MVKFASIAVIVICVLVACAVIGGLIWMVCGNDIDLSDPWQ